MRKRFTDLFAPLRFRDFRLLWGAEVFSQLGDWAGRLSLSVIVAEQTHSTLLTALVTTASVLPYIGIGQVLATYANRFFLGYARSWSPISAGRCCSLRSSSRCPSP